MKWLFLVICTMWLLLLLFVIPENNVEHGIFFIGLMVIYLFINKVEE